MHGRFRRVWADVWACGRGVWAHGSGLCGGCRKLPATCAYGFPQGRRRTQVACDLNLLSCLATHSAYDALPPHAVSRPPAALPPPAVPPPPTAYHAPTTFHPPTTSRAPAARRPPVPPSPWPSSARRHTCRFTRNQYRRYSASPLLFVGTTSNWSSSSGVGGTSVWFMRMTYRQSRTPALAALRAASGPAVVPSAAPVPSLCSCGSARRHRRGSVLDSQCPAVDAPAVASAASAAPAAAAAGAVCDGRRTAETTTTASTPAPPGITSSSASCSEPSTRSCATASAAGGCSRWL
eukprot:362508-Chlamydomonas_euryale.AAC.3